MRTEPSLYESDIWLEAVGQAAGAWQISPVDVGLASHGENLVYKITDSTGCSYALRLHRPGYHNYAELQSEQHWTLALNDAGLHVPVGVPLSADNYYTSFKLPNNEVRQVGLVNWLSGRPLWDILDEAGNDPSQHEKIAQHYLSLGKLTAQMHEQASRWTPPSDFVRHHLDADGFMGDSPFWGSFWNLPELTDAEKTLFKATKIKAHKELSTLPKATDNYSIIHADLHAGNLLVDELPDLSYTIIDFDDCGFGWHMYDMAVTLFYTRDFSGYHHCYDAYVAGYQSVRTLNDESLRLLPLFTLIRGLAILGWMHHRREVDRSDSLQHIISKVSRECEQYLNNPIP